MTDDELRAEVDAFLAEGGSGECEENDDGTPEGAALWNLMHPQRLVDLDHGVTERSFSTLNEVKA